MQSIEGVFPLLSTPKKVFIISHHKPDGDAIGSMLGLYHYLKKKGHEVTPVTPSEAPTFLEWIPGYDELMDYEEHPLNSLQALKEADIIFCLDFNDFSRTKHLTQQLTEADGVKVMIDHHLHPAPVWDYGMSEPAKSSTSEMVYDFIALAGDKELIDKDIAECLYTGIMTDTGSFRFPATTPDTHHVIAELMKTGMKHTYIHEQVYDSWSETRLHFVGYVLLEKMEIIPKYNAGLIVLSKKDLKLFNVNSGDTEGLVNYPLSISGIRFSTMITERGDEVKMSFRSKGDFDVSTFARENFNGGGHFNAAGGRSTENLEDTVARFKQILSDIHPR